MKNITPIILCGGSGTRLWPLSRKNYPKQFLNLVADISLFQQTILRLIDLENIDTRIEEIIVITNENHRFLALEQLDNLNLKIPYKILLEPESKNTAPALTFAAFEAYDKNPNSVLVVTPADHYIKDLKKFILVIRKSIKSVQEKTIVTLGIKATRPDTGFGYIQYEGSHQVKDVLSFEEKPDFNKAKQFIDDGFYTWNSGIFLLQSHTWLNLIQQCNPFIYEPIRRAWEFKSVDKWFVRPNPELFQNSHADSIDYAVMEKIKDLDIQVKLYTLDVGWSDLGSFTALSEIKEKDQKGNIFQGDIVSLNTKNTFAISSKKNISLLGLDNLIIIETSDSILIANKNDADSVKNIVKILEKNNRHLIDDNKKVNRPWGWFEILEDSRNYKVKRIQINPRKSISLQRHKKRSEHWIVVQGEASIIKNHECFKLTVNQSIFIKKNEIHRISNNTENILQIIEVQTGEYLGEDDIERLEDLYGRKDN